MVLGGEYRGDAHDPPPRGVPENRVDAAGAGEKPLSHLPRCMKTSIFFARLFGHDKAERDWRLTSCADTGLAPFAIAPPESFGG